MTSKVVQLNLAGGEISPSVAYRPDLTRSATGGRTFRNGYVSKTGAFVGRSGLVMGWETKDSTKHARLLDFIFNSTQAYILEFGDLYMRIGITGAQLVVPSALPWDTDRKYYPGDIVSVAGVAYTCKLIADNTVATPAAAPTFWTANTTDTAIPWDTLAVYAVGALVYFNGFNYYCTAPADATIADPATATAYWYKQSNVALAAGSSAWSALTSYAQFDRVSKGGLNYRANAANLNVDPTGASSQTWTPYNASIFEIPTPYTEDEVYGLTGKRVYRWQSNDVVYITHPSHPPYQLSRLGLTNWTITPATWGPTIAAPATMAASGGTGTGFDYRYRVTAIDAKSDEESLPGYGAVTTVTFDFSTTPNTMITSGGDPYITGDEVLMLTVVNNGLGSLLVNKTITLTRTSANHYQLVGTVADTLTLYTTGTGTTAPAYASIVNKQSPVAGNPNVVTWAAVTGAKEYWIYRDTTNHGSASASLYGFCGRSTTTTFNDSEPTPNLQQTPPAFFNPADSAGNYPAVVSNVQQRLVLASSTNDPAKIQMSQPGNWKNYTSRSPKNDSDVVEFTPASSQQNQIEHVVPLDEMALLTSGETYLALADADGKIGQGFPNLKSQDRYGASDVPPIIINGSVVYAENLGGVLREMGFTPYTNRAPSRDMASFAPHLFLGRTVKEIAFARAPDPVIWCVMDDGGLIAVTFLKEQQIEGWSRHDTAASGLFESAAVVPEGRRSVPYFAVKRTINGSTKRYVEFLADRKAGDPAYALAADARHFDAMVTYDGRNASTTTMALSGGTTWAAGETGLTLTGAATPATVVFVAGDVGNRYELHSGDDTALVEVTAFVSGTVVTVKSITAIPTSLRSVAVTDWTKLVTSVRMDHLAGVTVGILADGEVLSQRAVGGGTITLVVPAGLIHTGIPLESDFESLDVQIGTSAGNRVNTPQADIIVEDSRGFSVGPDFGNLKDYQPRGSPFSANTPTLTGFGGVQAINRWSEVGRICVRQRYGLPLTILGVVHLVAVGGHA